MTQCWVMQAVCGHFRKKCTAEGCLKEAVQCGMCYTWVHASCDVVSVEGQKSLAFLLYNIANVCELYFGRLSLSILSTVYPQFKLKFNLSLVQLLCSKHYNPINCTLTIETSSKQPINTQKKSVITLI